MNPLGNARAVFWAMAAACFAAAAAGLLARAANFMADQWAHESTGVAIVRIDGPLGEADILGRAQEAIRESPLVERANIVTAERAAALMEDWQGGEVRPADLPPLQLVEVDFVVGAPRDAPDRLERHLTERGLAAAVIAPRGNEMAAARNARLIRYAAIGGAAFLGLMMVLVVAFAARALALRRADFITALADIGATRARVGQEVGEEAARVGLWAGLLGAALAAVSGFSTLYFLQPSKTALDIVLGAHPFDYFPILLTPPAAALFASLGARAGASALHARAARLA